MSLAMKGNDLKKNIQCQQGNITARRSKMDPKIDTFCQIDTRVSAILWVEKVVFWTFSKLFWSCLESVWALFSVLKDPLLRVFSAPKFGK